MAVLVVITATPCGACKVYKDKTRKFFIEEAEKIPNLTIIEVNMPSFSFNVNNATDLNNKKVDLVPDIVRFVGWYPTFVLFSAKSWQSRGTLNGVILNGYLDESGRIQHSPNKISLDDRNGLI